MDQAPGTVQVHVVRVFCDDHDDHGNPLGVVMDGAALPTKAGRQEIAFELGFSETVFVDDPRTGALQIFTPADELPLAGHPLVGTAWLLSDLGHPVDTLRPPAGTVPCGVDGETAWIVADPEWAPPWRLEQLAHPAEVDAIQAQDRGEEAFDYVWAWRDEAAGIVRARAFAIEHGIVEDEATGSAALRLAQHLGRPIRIQQGRGSIIDATPVADGSVRVEGRVVLGDALLQVPVG